MCEVSLFCLAKNTRGKFESKVGEQTEVSNGEKFGDEEEPSKCQCIVKNSQSRKMGILRFVDTLS